MTAAVFFPDPDATRVMPADIDALAPDIVSTRSNERVRDPLLSPSPFFAAIAWLTRPCTLLPAGIATRFPATTGSVTLPVKSSSAWLEEDPTAESRVMWISVPAGTVSWMLRGIRGSWGTGSTSRRSDSFPAGGVS